jgi:hypothetical protein
MKNLLYLLLVFTLGSTLAAQSAPEPKVTHEAPAAPLQRIYKVNFLIYELADGKRINERTYTVPASSTGSSIQVGDRVPVTTEGKEGHLQWQYVDIGLSIDCNVSEQQDKLMVTSNLAISSIVLPEQSAEARSGGGNPVVRQLHQRFVALVSPGKPTLATSIDDINSKKRFQVEVTATRLE